MKKSKMRRGLLWVVTVAVVGAAIAGGLFMRKAAAKTERPVAFAREGEFQVMISCRGELIAADSEQVTAPLNVPNLSIVWLAPNGDMVKEGDPIVRFDESSAKRQLREKEAALGQAQATLDQAVAQASIQLEQDRLELATARQVVERAKLEVSKQEIVSRLKGEESRIDLGVAEEKMKVQQATLELNQTSGKAKISALEAVRDKTKVEVELTRHRLTQMELKSPSTGVVVYLMNFSAGWMNAKPFKVGDNVWPGSAIAEIPDLASLHIKAKVDENDRGRLQAGQEAQIRLDPFPEKTFQGKLASISLLTEQNFEWPPTRNFRGFAKVEPPDKRLRPGMQGKMDLIVEKIPKAISVPSKALFTRNGKPVVLLDQQGEFRAVEVKVVARNPDEVAVEGIKRGAKVALTDDEKLEKKQ
ncbi:MAG: efflux RND transporter periplasmic adaptor subunit [Acidobacteriia bacterium]|nr:efflux RND transporter periplasmic adaptor subunit [Terriglobia bacterium]